MTDRQLPDNLDIDELNTTIQSYILEFHQAKVENISKLNLDRILKKKNPYLYKSKNILTAGEFVGELLSAFVTSSEETMFGNVMEKLAIYVSDKIDGGWKSSAEGVDLEFDRDGVRYLVSIKSGVNWGNSSQINKMINDFAKASKTLRTSNSKINIRCINGCCYGKANTEYPTYTKIAGQEFWEFLTGDSDFYLDIIEPFGYKAKENTEVFESEFAKVVNKFTLEFLQKYSVNGEGIEIDWNAVVKLNSGKKENKS